jgi:mono/diheme cytochrome c family protein
MRSRILVGLAIAAATAAAFALPRRFPVRTRADSVQTTTLTAVMAQGLWTDEEVTAGNAWRRDFREARPVLRRGQTSRIRLKSADVVHSFSIPELGIDPVEVYPGRPVELSVTPSRSGRFGYYCTTVCGEGHFAMRGELRVTDSGEPAADAPAPRRFAYWRAPQPEVEAGRLARGGWQFQVNGCVTCHGAGGRGGVTNPNSMNATVPELSTLGRRTFLFTPVDAAAFGGLLGSGWRLEDIEEAPSVPLFKAVKTQYLSYRQLVREGRRSAKLHPAGPRPPLDMPAWQSRLSDADIDGILAYLVSLSEARPAPPTPQHSSIREGEAQ